MKVTPCRVYKQNSVWGAGYPSRLVFTRYEDQCPWHQLVRNTSNWTKLCRVSLVPLSSTIIEPGGVTIFRSKYQWQWCKHRKCLCLWCNQLVAITMLFLACGILRAHCTGWNLFIWLCLAINGYKLPFSNVRRLCTRSTAWIWPSYEPVFVSSLTIAPTAVSISSVVVSFGQIGVSKNGRSSKVGHWWRGARLILGNDPSSG